MNRFDKKMRDLDIVMDKLRTEKDDLSWNSETSECQIDSLKAQVEVLTIEVGDKEAQFLRQKVCIENVQK